MDENDWLSYWDLANNPDDYNFRLIIGEHADHGYAWWFQKTPLQGRIWEHQPGQIIFSPLDNKPDGMYTEQSTHGPITIMVKDGMVHFLRSELQAFDLLP